MLPVNISPRRFHSASPRMHAARARATAGCLPVLCLWAIIQAEVNRGMKTSNIIYELRSRAGLSQDELAEKVFVTRQAVSRWENGETTPNTETLKLLSSVFDVSINTLLGSPRRLICQCCGMPLDDSTTSRERSGSFNESYCKWCYADGRFAYDSLDELISFCAGHMAGGQFTPEQVQDYLKGFLPGLDYWKQYAALGGREKLGEFKSLIMQELNALHIDGMPAVDALHPISGSSINFSFTLPNGNTVRFLDDRSIYLGNQLPCLFDESRCFGVAAGTGFLLVYTCGADGDTPELLVYKKR